MHALDIKQLFKTYANGVQALKGIDLTINQGDFLLYWGLTVLENRQPSV